MQFVAHFPSSLPKPRPPKHRSQSEIYLFGLDSSPSPTLYQKVSKLTPQPIFPRFTNKKPVTQLPLSSQAAKHWCLHQYNYQYPLSIMSSTSTSRGKSGLQTVNGTSAVNPSWVTWIIARWCPIVSSPRRING